MDIALAQQFLPDNPLEAFQQGLNTIKDAANAGADLVVFPELSFTPFYPRVPIAEREGEDVLDLAETVPGPTVESVSDIAAEFEVVVIFNMLERDGEEAYSTTPVIDSDGTVLGCTRMMHVPDYNKFHQKDYYTPGNTGAPVYDTSAGRIGVATGYDRHYPEYLRALALQDAELVAVPQAGTAGKWPGDVRQSEMCVSSFHHGFFTAMANRVGQESNLLFDGNSLVTGPTGRVVADAPSGSAIILMASIDLDRCSEAPARNRFLKDRRPDQYEKGAVSLSASVAAHQEVLEEAEPGAVEEERAAQEERAAREAEDTEDEAEDTENEDEPAEEWPAQEDVSSDEDASSDEEAPSDDEGSADDEVSADGEASSDEDDDADDEASSEDTGSEEAVEAEEKSVEDPDA